MPKVLVVEDYDPYFASIKRDLEEEFEVLRAKTLEEGDDLFKKHLDIDLIIMDACVPGSVPNSMPLVKMIIDSGYLNPIIACSSNPSYMRDLVSAGATHKSEKDCVVEMALGLFGL